MSTPNKQQKEDYWTFQESFLWTDKMCKTKSQSPININTDLIQRCNTLCNFQTHYNPSKCYINYKNNLIRIKYSVGSYLEFEGVLYELKEITIHLPTLHSIDNEKYDIEICMIHTLSSDNTETTTDKTVTGVILCRMFEIGPHFGKPEQFMNQFINEVPREEIDYDKEVIVSDKWGAELLLPTNKSFYMYDGSLPFPPCTNNYKVIVYEEIGFIGRTNIELLKLNIDTNIRPIQGLNNRPIFYKADTGTYKKEEAVGSDNKYLKCEIKNTVFEKKTVTAASSSSTTIIKEEYGIKPETKNIIKQVLLSLIMILILASAFLMTNYLFYHKYAQKMIKTLVGPSNMLGWSEKWDSPTCTVGIDEAKPSAPKAGAKAGAGVP